MIRAVLWCCMHHREKSLASFEVSECCFSVPNQWRPWRQCWCLRVSKWQEQGCPRHFLTYARQQSSWDASTTAGRGRFQSSPVHSLVIRFTITQRLRRVHISAIGTHRATRSRRSRLEDSASARILQECLPHSPRSAQTVNATCVELTRTFSFYSIITFILC